MPTILPERNIDVRPLKFRVIALICLGYGMVAIVMVGLIAFDSRVVMWISQAAQAEFVDASPPTGLEPARLAVMQ